MDRDNLFYRVDSSERRSCCLSRHSGESTENIDEGRRSDNDKYRAYLALATGKYVIP